MKQNPIEAMSGLHQTAGELIGHIEQIVLNWDRGDLAGAVNAARNAATAAKKRIGKREPNIVFQKLIRATQQLVDANARGEAEGGSVDWTDIDNANAIACEALDHAYGRRSGRTWRLACQTAHQNNR